MTRAIGRDPREERRAAILCAISRDVLRLRWGIRDMATARPEVAVRTLVLSRE
jgi:hypothetical protein